VQPSPEIQNEKDRPPATGADWVHEMLARQPMTLPGKPQQGADYVLVQGNSSQEKHALPTVHPGIPVESLTPIHRGMHDPTGQRQATQEAQHLKHLTNEQFVAQIEHDCSVGPHLEWGIAGGTILGKSLVKGWILSKAGESMGPTGRFGGLAAGVAIGTVTGLYTAYETADLLENSCRAHAFEERLTQTHKGAQTEPDQPFDPLTRNYEIERGIPGVRTVVDFSSDHIKTALGRPITDQKALNFDKALFHSNLNDASYISWAHKESALPLGYQIKHDLGFAAMALAGGVFAARKLHLGPQGTVVLAAGGMLAGIGLSHLGIAAKENTSLAELLEARLLSKPNDVPRP